MCSVRKCKTLFITGCHYCFNHETRLKQMCGAFKLPYKISVSILNKQMLRQGVEYKKTQEFQDAVLVLLNENKVLIQSLNHKVAGFENNFRYNAHPRCSLKQTIVSPCIRDVR